jgi:GlpG protein
MPQCVDCGRDTPREEMFGPPDELRCPACVQRRFPATNIPKPHRSSLLLRKPPVTTFVLAASIVATLLYWSGIPAVSAWLFADLDEIWDHQLWRLLTAVFPHLDPFHLVFDIIVFWRFGKVTEQWMGSLPFAGFVIATAVGSSAAEVLSGNRGAGLSGVAFALFGFLFALRKHEDFAAEQMTPSVVNWIVFFFFLCIALTYMNIFRIANGAHTAGVILGWLFGRAYLVRQKVAATAGVVIVCIALGLATQYMPWNGNYDWHRGAVCANRNDYPGAAKWYELAAKRLPDEKKQRADGLHAFYSGNVCADQEDYAGAMKWYARAAELLSGENKQRARHNVEWAKEQLEIQQGNDP